MKFRFEDKRIAGVLVVLPEHEVLYDDEIGNYDFPEKNTKRLKRVLGFDRRRVVKGPTTTGSDLAVFGLRELARTGELDLGTVDALICVTETPDYFMPPTANVIQGALELGPDTYCLDINQGCAGFVIGLIQGFMLLDQPAISKVVLINADTLSRTAHKKDRNAAPLLGDAAAITILERGGAATVHANCRMDGTRHRAIMIPAGGFKQPVSEATTADLADEDGNVRSLGDYHMDGIDVFNFVQNEVPESIEEALADAGVEADAIDHFLFHQPNTFMLKKLAGKLGIDKAKMPHDVVTLFGNNSSATIPTALVHGVGDAVVEGTGLACLSGFGVGLTWASMVLPVGDLAFCRRVDMPEDG